MYAYMWRVCVCMCVACERVCRINALEQRHPCVCPVYDTCIDAGVPHMHVHAHTHAFTCNISHSNPHQCPSCCMVYDSALCRVLSSCVCMLLCDTSFPRSGCRLPDRGLHTHTHAHALVLCSRCFFPNIMPHVHVLMLAHHQVFTHRACTRSCTPFAPIFPPRLA